MQDFSTIIAGCIKNERKAQKQLYDAFSAAMLGVCARYASDIADAEDILQEGFLKIFDNIKSYSGTGNFAAWVKKIIVNTAITHYHKHKKHHFNDDLDEVKEKVPDDRSADEGIVEDDLYRVLQRLPEGYKIIFNLYAIEGYKHKEIAEKLNIEESTSKSQYLRAKKWMQKELGKLEKLEKAD